MRRARGFVFDLDGTLVSNMDLHVEAWTRFTERHGLPPFTLEVRAKLDGKRNSDIFPIIFERALSPGEIDNYADEKESLYREISRGRLRPLPGLDRLLGALILDRTAEIVRRHGPRRFGRGPDRAQQHADEEQQTAVEDGRTQPSHGRADTSFPGRGRCRINVRAHKCAGA